MAQAEKAAIADAAAGGLIPQPSIEKQVSTAFICSQTLKSLQMSGKNLLKRSRQPAPCVLKKVTTHVSAGRLDDGR